MLVTIEGIDGAGKSTVIEALKDEWPDAVYTQEPTETWLGDAVRRSINDDASPPLVDFFLFTADHASHLETTIEPALEAGRLVFCDRYVDSRLAYQSVSLEPQVEDPLDWIRGVHEPWTVLPDVTILLDLPPGTALQRLGGGAMKFERREFLEKVRRNYRDLAENTDRYRVVDATQTPDNVVEDCVELVMQELE